MKEISNMINSIKEYAKNSTQTYNNNEFKNNIPKHIYNSIKGPKPFGSADLVYPANEEWKPLDNFKVWKDEQGWWSGDYLFPSNNGLVDYKYEENDPTKGLFDYRNYFGFIRIKLIGTTFKQRNLFIRPPVDLNLYADASGVISIEKMKSFGYNTDDIFKINKTQELSQEDKEYYETIYNEKKLLGQSIYVDRYDKNDNKLSNKPINFMKWTEKIFQAEQSAIDNKGNLYGLYQNRFPTYTYVFGDNTILYQVPFGNNIYQNQLTTLNKPNHRVRTAQGFNPMTGWGSDYASYYREVRLDPSGNYSPALSDADNHIFFNKLKEKREHYRTNNTTTYNKDILHPTKQDTSITVSDNTGPKLNNYTIEDFFINDSWWNTINK